MFDFNKVENFDRHIALSIPAYDLLNKQVLDYSDYFIDWGFNVYDLGCSTGKLLKLMRKEGGVGYFGIDDSNLLPASCDQIKYIRADLHNVVIEDACLITSIFTLQFLHRKTRERLLKNVKTNLIKGGAFIVAEKTYSEDPKIQSIMDSVYKESKSHHFSHEEIARKEIELRSNMKPARYSELIEELSQIGIVQEIWRSFNFVCFLVIKN